MFEEYLQDAYEFKIAAEKSMRESEDRISRRYYRASVFYTSGAIEAFVNYVGDAFAKGNALSLTEIAFLNDKRLVCSPEKGALIERVEFNRVEDKLKFLIKKFDPAFNFNCTSWSQLSEFKDFRDSLVHPRKTEDELELSEYKKGLMEAFQV